jgi:aminoglycoside phosphotransferase (APT) family kinase protein
MYEWSADVRIDEELVRRLLAQFPDLELEALRPFAEGWDYSIWLANETWAFRFPRREVAVPGVRLEIATLPSLAPLLPLPVPVAAFLGEPTDEFPRPFFGSLLLPGRELTEVRLDDGARTEVGRSLASFLRALHDARLEVELPVDSNGRADMTRRVPATRQQLNQVEALGLWRRSAEVDRLLDDAEALPPPEPVAIVHGDLHVRQVLVEDARLTGVIDWVDVCRSDPAIDLSMYWSFLPETGRQPFLHAYGAATDAQLLRARVLAFSLCASLARYGNREGFAALEAEAVEGLARAASA